MLQKTPPELLHGHPREPGKARIVLPTFHPAQARLFRTKGKYKAARCGRRWGKNVFGEAVATSDAIKGRLVGWFAPENKRARTSYEVIAEYLERIKKRSNKTDGFIETINRGSIEFWSMEDEDAGRSRKYHRVIIDEGAFTKPKKGMETWLKAIKPTLVDYDGSAIVMSNTKGIDPDNFLWQICNEKKHGFVDFHAPTMSNPFIPHITRGEAVEAWQKRRAAYFDELIRSTPPLVYQQEYLAEFVDWSGAAFFTRDSLLQNGQPVDFPARCHAVFAIIDSATKTGKEHDGTAVVYFAVIRNHIRPVQPDGTIGPEYSLVILDWDITQIEGDLLISWLPGVFGKLEDFAQKTGAMMGSIGTMIEDKNSGSILIQQAQRRGMKAFPIESKLADMGKDERAISISGYVYRGLVKISRYAYEKTSMYKETTRNHLLGQVVGFRIGDKDRNRQDDLADAFMYGCIVALGNAEGF